MTNERPPPTQALYNRVVVVRKYEIARQAAYRSEGTLVAGVVVNRSTLPHCGRVAEARHPEWRVPCSGGGTVVESDLSPLPQVKFSPPMSHGDHWPHRLRLTLSSVFYPPLSA